MSPQFGNMAGKATIWMTKIARSEVQEELLSPLHALAAPEMEECNKTIRLLKEPEHHSRSLLLVNSVICC